MIGAFSLNLTCNIFPITMLVASLLSMQYVDIHTTKPTHRPDVISLASIRITKDTEEFVEDGLCTVGLHPSDVDDDWRDAFDIVEELASDELVLGIGACGLDRACIAPWLLQIDAFNALADLAERVSKPMVVHCVKAYDELFQVQRDVDAAQTWVLHGFVKGQELARQYLDAGMHLSFDSNVMRETPTLIEVVRFCPDDRIHLETGSNSVVSIEMVTERAARLRGITTESLCEILERNFNSVFKQ